MKIITYNIKHIDYEEMERIQITEIKNVKEIMIITMPQINKITICYRYKDVDYNLLNWEKHEIPMNYHFEIVAERKIIKEYSRNE